MERLTQRLSNGVIKRTDVKGDSVMNRLAAYEDTGLTPEEIADLEYKLSGVMHFVDKWLDDEDLKLDEVNRAAKMREITLEITERQENEIAALKTENERLETERDAVIKTLEQYAGCRACGNSQCHKRNGRESCKFQWRGLEDNHEQD